MGRNRWMDIEKLSCECCEWWFLDVGGMYHWLNIDPAANANWKVFQKWTEMDSAQVGPFFQIGVTIVMGYPIDHSLIGFSHGKPSSYRGSSSYRKAPKGCSRRLVLPPCRSLHHHQRRLFQAWKDCEDGGFHPVSFSYHGRHIFFMKTMMN